MALMKRGANVALTREVPGLAGVVLGVRLGAGVERILLDSFVLATLLCDEEGRVLSPEHFVFFNQLTSPDESVTAVEHALDGDLEQIVVDLASVPADVGRIVMVGYVNESLLAESKAARRTLGQLKECTVRALNRATSVELVRSENLAAGFGPATAAVLCELYRHDGDWKFKVVGDGYTGGITGIAADYHLAL